MGINLSPTLKRELENLEKDSASRKLAMKVLKSYVKDLDSKAIPIFLAQVSETKDSGSVSGEYTISLYEILARNHGPKIVPQIETIMTTIINTLTSSGGSFPLQQACSRVVPAIARYAIEPTTPKDKKRSIIHSLCTPLANSLISSEESLSSGAALCLKALVESDNWRLASDDMVNKVCQNLAVALEEKSSQSNLHMGLVMAVVKHNPLIVEPYARLLVQSGLRILSEGNSHKRISVIQMMNFLMKCLDPRSVFSELDLIVEEMEKCQSDQLGYVREAAFEALQTAKRIARSKTRILIDDLSPEVGSPESHVLDSSIEYESFVESSISTTRFSPKSSQGSSRSNAFCENSCRNGLTDDCENTIEQFGGFLTRSSTKQLQKSCTSSPQKSSAHLDIGNINLFSTPRKLIHSLQDQNDISSDSSSLQSQYDEYSPRFHQNSYESCEEKENQNIYAGNSNEQCDEYSRRFHQNGYESCEEGENQNIYAGNEQLESVSSTNDLVKADMEVYDENTNETHKLPAESKTNWKSKLSARWIVGLMIILPAVSSSIMWIHSQDEAHHHLVPT